MARETAQFALCYGIAPSETARLTQLERQAFHTEARRLNDLRK